MPPKDQPLAWVLDESDAATEDKGVATLVPPSAENKSDIIYPMAFLLAFLYPVFVYGGYIFITQAMWSTRIFTLILHVMTLLGVTAGEHRLWSHKSYKARLPLRITLMLFNSLIVQYSVLNWAHDHRMHHKYSETDADPHNRTRGLIFAHIGWLAVRKHPEVEAKKDSVDMSDLLADPVLQFQRKYYVILVSLLAVILPTYLPTLWGETLWISFIICAVFRFWFTYNAFALINSYAHFWGIRPYDGNINPTENKWISFMTLGEGFHNYHHTFPWDYKTGELGGYALNPSTLFIDAMAKIGWAYDLKTVSPDIVEKRVKRTGDGSHLAWGWDDAPVEHKMGARIISPKKSA